jgi:hypothetical protein
LWIVTLWLQTNVAVVDEWNAPTREECATTATHRHRACRILAKLNCAIVVMAVPSRETFKIAFVSQLITFAMLGMTEICEENGCSLGCLGRCLFHHCCSAFSTSLALSQSGRFLSLGK